VVDALVWPNDIVTTSTAAIEERGN